MTLKRAARVSIVLGVGSLFAVLVSHLALTDIRHGEGDLGLEWNGLRVCFGVILAFQVSALLTLRRVIRDVNHRGLHAALLGVQGRANAPIGAAQQRTEPDERRMA